MALNSQYMIAPNLQEYYVDKTSGLPLTGGNVFYYADSSRSDLKTVYGLSGTFGSYSFVALPNPVPLSGVGTTTDGDGNDIRVYYYPYDSNGAIQNYYIVVKDANGVTQLTRQAWPNISIGATSGVFSYNFVRNNTFYAWSNTNLYTNVKAGSLNQYDYFVDDWSYQQNDSSQTINLSQGVFSAGSSLVPGNPPYYLVYQNSNAGITSGIYNYFQQYYKSVQTLSGQNVAISIWAKQETSLSNATFSATLTQYYGSGGSASVVTTLFSVATVTPGQWKEYVGTAFLPSLSGTIGTQGDDALILSINMPLNVACTIDIGPIRLEQGSVTEGTEEQSNDDIKKNTNVNTLYPPFSTGDVKFTFKNVADKTWLLMDDNTIGSPSSFATHAFWSVYALYSLLWNNIWNATLLPIYDSSGTLTTYGASAKSDWDANKRLSLTKQLGRVIAGAQNRANGTSYSFAASNVGGNLSLLVTFSGAQPFINGQSVTFTSSGTLPGGLTAGVVYIVTVIGLTSPTTTTIQVSTSVANAIALNYVAFNGAGSGTLAMILNTDTLGYFNGEFEHTMAINEMINHKHSQPPGGGFIDNAIPGGASSGSDFGGVSGETGFVEGYTAQVPFNVTQPTVYSNVMIKL